MTAYTLEESLTKEFVSKLREISREQANHVVAGGADDYARYQNRVGYVQALNDCEEVFLDMVKKYFP